MNALSICDGDMQEMWRYVLKLRGAKDWLLVSRLHYLLFGQKVRQEDVSWRYVVASPNYQHHQDFTLGTMYGICQGIVLFVPHRSLPVAFTGLVVPTTEYPNIPYFIYTFERGEEFASCYVDTDLENIALDMEDTVERISAGSVTGQPCAAALRGACRRIHPNSMRYYFDCHQLEGLLTWLKPYHQA